jgi:hypothetical protein
MSKASSSSSVVVAELVPPLQLEYRFAVVVGRIVGDDTCTYTYT